MATLSNKVILGLHLAAGASDGYLASATDILNESADQSVETTLNSLKDSTVNGKKVSENPILNGSDISLSGYVKPTSTSDIVATDTINTAIGKLEQAIALSQSSDEVTKEIQSAIDTLKGNSSYTSLKDAETAIALTNANISTEVSDRKAAISEVQSNLSSHTTDYDNPHKVTKAQIGLTNVTDDAQVKRSEMGVANGVATLDSNGTVPTSQLPSYVDDVVDVYASYTKSDSGTLSNIVLYSDLAKTKPITGETGKIYLDVENGFQFRFTGSTFTTVGSPTVIGEITGTAFDGAKGKVAYDHAQNKGSAFASGLYKITTNSEGHVTDATPVTSSDLTSLGIATDSGIADLEKNVSTLSTQLTAEISDRKEADTTLQTSISTNEKAIASEVTRAQAAESSNKDLITAETARAKEVEATKVDKVTGKSLVDDTEIAKLIGLSKQSEIDSAIADAKSVGTDALAQITAEVTRAKTAESANATNIASNKSDIAAEVTRAQAAEATKVDKVTGKSLVSDTEITKLASLDSQADTDAAIADAKKAGTDAQSAITTETTRATTAESDLKGLITTETSRAKDAENDLFTSITTEVSRAKESEADIKALITAETTRAEKAESSNTTAITTEVSRAKTEESNLSSRIDTLETNQTTVNTNVSSLSTKVDTLSTTVSDNSKAITTETARAKEAENTIQSSLTSEITRAKEAEQANTTAINNEITRAKAAEKDNTDLINSETTRAKEAESELSTSIKSINTDIESLLARIEALENAVNW